jgi:hypothetical protein
MLALRHVLRSLFSFTLCVTTFTAAASDPLISVEGGASYMGGKYAAEDRAPAVFIDALLNAHMIGESGFTWSPVFTAGWIDGRDIARYRTTRYTTRDHIWMVAGGIRLHYGAPSAWYQPLFFSFQPSLHTGRTEALSSSYEFTSTLGWQAEHWMIGIRHSSNAFLHMPNRGETMVIAGISFNP